MVSEPNFVLGIRQTSLTNKEDSHVHTAIRSHTYLFAGSRLHSISQPSWLTAVSRSSSPSNRVSPNQICAHQAFACRNRSHRRAPRPPARKTQKSGQPKASHAPLLASESLSRAASNSSLPNRLPGTRAALKALLSTDLLGLRIWWLYDVARASTCHLGFRHLLHAPVNLARAFHAPKHCC